MSNISGNISKTLQLGGVGINNPLTIPEGNSEGYFTLECGINPTGGNFYRLYKNGAQYQVTAAKTCQVVAISYYAGTVNDQVFQLVSATATFADNASSLTGPVYQYGASGLYGFGAIATYTWYTTSQTYSFAASTFPGVQAHNASRCGMFIICKEV